MRGRVRTVRVQGKCQMGGERHRWASASVGAQTCADDVGARERLEMGWEKGRWA